jgi:hypothetical protein
MPVQRSWYADISFEMTKLVVETMGVWFEITFLCSDHVNTGISLVWSIPGTRANHISNRDTVHKLMTAHYHVIQKERMRSDLLHPLRSI